MAFCQDQDSSVTRQTSMIIESHLAEVTLVRFLIGVNDSMHFQLFVGCNILRANVTFGWIVMNIHVVIEVGLKSERLFAKCAFKSMCFLMLFERSQGLKSKVASPSLTFPCLVFASSMRKLFLSTFEA